MGMTRGVNGLWPRSIPSRKASTPEPSFAKAALVAACQEPTCAPRLSNKSLGFGKGLGFKFIKA